MFISDSCRYACASLGLTPQLPSGLFMEPPLDSGGVDDGVHPKSASEFRNLTPHFCLHQCRSLVPHFLSKLNVTRHWTVLRKENGGGVCVCGEGRGGGS